MMWQALMTVLRRWSDAIHGFAFGAAMSWVTVPFVKKKNKELEELFMLLIISDLMGVPIAPSTLRFRLLPYMWPRIAYWKRRLNLWDEELENANLRHLGH